MAASNWEGKGSRETEVTNSEITGKNYETTETWQCGRQNKSPPKMPTSQYTEPVTTLWLRQGELGCRWN